MSVRNILIAVGLFAFALFGSFTVARQAHAEEIPRSFPHALLYVTNSKSALASLRAHVSSMDIIAPQIYASDKNGKLLGSPGQEMLDIAKNADAKVMPLVVNQNFSQTGIHDLLMSDAAQNRLIVALIKEARKYGYIGYQYDFEHMYVTDRDLYSTFVEKSATIFHAAGLQLSVAMSPRHTDDKYAYGVGSYDNWTGAFDYAAIGKAADFVSIMAYDDSLSVGPTAALPWVEDVVKYSLERIPAEKISLGVPFYAWVKNFSTGKRENIVAYPAIEKMLKSKSYLSQGWSDKLGVPYVIYMKGGKKLIAWYEDRRSFEEKMDLVSEHNLRGFSAWALGQEDEAIWDEVLVMRAPYSGLALNR